MVFKSMLADFIADSLYPYPTKPNSLFVMVNGIIGVCVMQFRREDFYFNITLEFTIKTQSDNQFKSKPFSLAIKFNDLYLISRIYSTIQRSARREVKTAITSCSPEPLRGINEIIISFHRVR